MTRAIKTCCHPWAPLCRTYAELDEERLQEIQDRGIEIAETLGLAIPKAEARERLSDIGVRVDSGRAYIPAKTMREFLEQRRQWLGPEPARGRENKRPMSMDIAVAAQYDLDLDTDEIAPVTTERLIRQVKLVHAGRQAGMRINGIPMNIPADVSPAMVPIIEFLVSQEYSDQPPFYCWNWPEQTLQYLLEMHRAIGDRNGYYAATWVLSPLRLAGNCFEMMWARMGECDSFHVHTHGIAGASLPIQPLAAAAVSVGEALAAATVIWLLSSGKRVDFSIGMVPFDVRHLSQLYNGPEQQLFEILCERINEFYGHAPERSSNLITMAKRPGFQAGAEKMAGAIWGAARGATRLGGAAALSRDEVFSDEQMILDWEICCYADRVRQGISPENSSEWLELAREGIHGLYLGVDTTLDRYQDFNWQPGLFDRYTLMAWRERGEREVREAARARARELLAQYHYDPPAGMVRDLHKIAERARRELG